MRVVLVVTEIKFDLTFMTNFFLYFVRRKEMKTVLFTFGYDVAHTHTLTH